ncbi:hypothetical protein EDC50_1161 [Vulcaniibacterium tengchongense]|uniref:YdhG-like domain-containing protein n=1 Tax=Vulcaniibacterium tengchongense TaxID=1273429 RepID=A0A3N4VGS2_9GAMM|nr:hypothetical protein EDC50_1161 [Vulcaniibacterium tengchongense]
MAGKTSGKATEGASSRATKTAAGKPAAPRAQAKRAAGAPASSASGSGAPVLLSGGNPQIPKGYGDAPVQAYIAAMPGWKREVGKRLDALIERSVPGVRKAVKWNSPFYGTEDDSWFLSFHCLAKYVKVTFFRGASLRPAPPVESKYPQVRYAHVPEDGAFDEAQFAGWVRQASRLPGERM